MSEILVPFAFLELNTPLISYTYFVFHVLNTFLD